HIPLGELRRADVRGALIRMQADGLSKAVSRNALVALSSCLTAAVDDGVLNDNPARRAGRRIFRKPPEGAARARAIPLEHHARLLAAVPGIAPELADLFFVLSGTGAR